MESVLKKLPAQPRAGAQALRALLWFGAGALLSGGRVLDRLNPLGLALAFGLPGADGLAALAGAAVGSVLFCGPLEAAPFLSTLAMNLVLRSLLSGTQAALLCCLVLPGMQGMLVFSGAAAPETIALQTLNGVLTAALAVLLQRVSPYSGTGRLLIALMAAVAAQRWQVGFVHPAVLLAGLLCLVKAAGETDRNTGLAAVAAGAAVCCADPRLVFAAQGLAVGTLAARQLWEGSRTLLCVWWLSGLLFGCLCAGPTALSFQVLGTGALTAAVFRVLPPGWWQPTEQERELGAARRLTTLSEASARLCGVADSLTRVSDTVEQVYRALPRRADTFARVEQYIQGELCRDCGRWERCWQQEAESTRRGLAALEPVLTELGQIPVERLPLELCRCLHPLELCGSANRGWLLLRQRRESRLQAQALRCALTEQYQAVADSLRQVAAQMNQVCLQEKYRTARLERLFSDLGLDPLDCQASRDSLGRLRASVTLPRDTLAPEALEALRQEAQRACRCRFGPPQQVRYRSVVTLLFAEAPVYEARFGTAGVQAETEASGDVTDCFCDAFGNACLLLCDGMGVGLPAAVDGAMAANLTGQLLQAGFPPQSAARLVNVALSLKGEEESSSTLDVARVDLNTGEATVYKAGAAPGFWLHGDRTHRLESPGLPVGILGKVVARQQTVKMGDGDWLVLVSDGALQDGPDWLCQQLELSRRVGHDPGEAARILAQMASQRAESAHRRDDITVAVLALHRCDAPTAAPE